MRIEIMNLFKGGKNKFFFFMPSIYLFIFFRRKIYLDKLKLVYMVCVYFNIYSPE